MGTNFYIFTSERELCKKWFDTGDYELVDSPEFGYLIHIAKTSYGWVPLFQSYSNIKSVFDIKRLYDGGGFTLIDEYGRSYDWTAFKDRVIDFGNDREDAHSHLEYDPAYSYMFFKDPEGYEFHPGDFC